jgi:GNAT superfamily N-acetyltransferase
MSDINERISFRAAVPEDAAALSRLAFKSKAHWGYDIDFMRRCKPELTYSPAQIEQPGYRFQVCEQAGRPVGFYALELKGEGRGELEALFVSPDSIGKGIGRSLVDKAKEEARSLGIDVVVIQGDPNAEAFYLGVGAVAAGYRESASIPGRFLPLFTLPTA